ncbi:MAG: hypothetical protein ACXW2U_06285 [Telluria sp.]
MRATLVARQGRLRYLRGGKVDGYDIQNAGTCQVSNDMAEDVLGALCKRISTEG